MLQICRRISAHISQHIPQHRGRVGVTGDDRHFPAPELKRGLQFCQDGFHKRVADFAIVQGDQHKSITGSILQGHRLGNQPAIGLVRLPFARGVTRQANRQFGGNVPHGNTNRRAGLGSRISTRAWGAGER